MARIPQKTPSQCPACGYSQLEPPRLISTYCRSCGGHYEVAKQARGTQAALPPLPSPARQQTAQVHCFQCGASHPVSARARCTICPGCNTSIELEDVTFLSPASRRVDTRGKLRIGPDGCLSSSWIVCGSARIQGRIVGRLISLGEVHVATNEACVCHITAPTIVIEKNCRPTFTQALHTQRLVVYGCLTGVVHCQGTVHVCRGGRLEAEVQARSVTVEKGGVLLGSCRVNGTSTIPETSSSASSNGWAGALCPAV